jgi:putative phage-type endonuclease
MKTHSPEWHEARRQGIGGSDAPLIVLGELYGRTVLDLYNEKRGNTEPVDLSDNPDVQRGNALEPIAIDIFRAATGLHVIPGGEPRDGFMRGNLDGRTWEEYDIDKEPDAILEIKCPRSFTLSRIRDDGVPAHHQIQCQHYMMVTGLPLAYLCYFDVNAWTVEIYELPRNDRLIDQILIREKAFWKHVQEGEPPELHVEPVDVPVVGKTAVTVTPGDYEEDVLLKFKRAYHLSKIAKSDLDAAKADLESCWPDIDGEKAKSLIVPDSIRVSASPKKSGGLTLRPTFYEE